MDYKQKYEEALRLAKSYYDTSDGGANQFLDTLFPELRESEDERIRKTLIEELSACNTVGELKFRLPAPTREECIAWLEKQKEPKPVDEEELSKFCEANFNAGKRVVLNNPEEYGLPKPAGWSEEDDQLIGFIFDLLNDLFWRKDWAMSKEECLERLKSLRPSWKPSEDEERLINTSISFLKDFADKGYENAVECIDWLKSKLNGNSGK